MSILEDKIEARYQKFFSDMDIDSETGIYGGEYKDSDKTEKRFATYPFIGSHYETAKKKILFVGMDIGKDEKKDGQRKFQNFTERRSNIVAQGFGYNKHMAGTYISTLYLLKSIYRWQALWNKATKFKTCEEATKTKLHKDDNPLEYIALTNFYKFVNVDRVTRSGGRNRSFLNSVLEKKLFQDEIRLLKPDIIVFQSRNFKTSLMSDALGENIIVLQAYHPSNRQDYLQPEKYVSTLLEIKRFEL